MTDEIDALVKALNEVWPGTKPPFNWETAQLLIDALEDVGYHLVPIQTLTVNEPGGE